jgi:hypothetical protein
MGAYRSPQPIDDVAGPESFDVRLPEEVNDAVFPEDFLLWIHCFGKAVRQHEHDIPRIELHVSFFVARVLLHTEGKTEAGGVEPGDAPRTPEQRLCLTRIRKRDRARNRVQRGKKERHKMSATRMSVGPAIQL